MTTNLNQLPTDLPIPEDDGSRTIFIYLEDNVKGKTNSKSLKLKKTEDYTDVYSLVDEQIDSLVDKGETKNQAFKKLSRAVISNWFN
jgi:hypothetical protein